MIEELKAIYARLIESEDRDSKLLATVILTAIAAQHSQSLDELVCLCGDFAERKVNDFKQEKIRMQ